MSSGIMKSETFPVSLHHAAVTERNPAKPAETDKVPNNTNSNRPCKEHSFLTDVADVRAMEQGLLQLLEDFHSGKLQAFGGSMTFEKMDQIREQQERLARLHFEMEILQDIPRRDIDSGDNSSSADEKMSKLITQLHAISASIQKIQN